MENKYLHEVVITAIIVKDGPSTGAQGEVKYLITRRAASKKRFPAMWTVPGGKLETDDYINLPKDTTDYWYNVLEKVLKREVMEEAGISIKNITYVTSLATVHQDGAPSLVISCMADYESGEVKLDPAETDDFKWVSLKEAAEFKLIDGIFDELSMAENQRQGIKTEWKRS